MHEHAYDALKPRWATHEDIQSRDYVIARRLGFPLPLFRVLQDEVVRDLDPDVYGIGWWEPYDLGITRRILLSDHLVIAVPAVVQNLIEAHIHLVEFQHWKAEHQKVHRYAIWFAPARFFGVVPMRGPRRESLRPHDELPDLTEELHMVGFFRAIGSLLDCLAQVVIIVAGLEVAVRKAGWGDLSRHLEPANLARRPNGADAVRLLDPLGKVDASGPAGWLAWSLDMRNMLVHRPRRMTFSVARRERGTGPADVVLHLPRDPGASEVEVMRDSGGPHGAVLGEDAETTMNAIFASSASLARALGPELVAVWNRRRSNLGWVEQPRSQWPSTVREASTGYEGATGQPPDFTGMSGAVLAERNARRYDAAALWDHQRVRWAGFD